MGCDSWRSFRASAFDLTTIGKDTIITYVLIYTFGVLIGQDIWQRVFTARNSKIAKYAGTAAGVYCVLYGLACAVIGMAAKVLLPNLDNVNNAFAAVIQVALPDGIRSLVITAAMAAMMSTASAGLLAASSTLSEDLLPKVWRQALRPRHHARLHAHHGRARAVRRSRRERCAERAHRSPTTCSSAAC